VEEDNFHGAQPDAKWIISMSSPITVLSIYALEFSR
jgi:hypothetical protein